MAADNPFQDIFNFQIVDPPNASQRPDADDIYSVGGYSLPNFVRPNATPDEDNIRTPGGFVSNNRYHLRRQKLALLQLADWKRGFMMNNLQLIFTTRLNRR